MKYWADLFVTKTTNKVSLSWVNITPLTHRHMRNLQIIYKNLQIIFSEHLAILRYNTCIDIFTVGYLFSSLLLLTSVDLLVVGVAAHMNDLDLELFAHVDDHGEDLLECSDVLNRNVVLGLAWISLP